MPIDPKVLVLARKIQGTETRSRFTSDADILSGALVQVETELTTQAETIRLLRDAAQRLVDAMETPAPAEMESKTTLKPCPVPWCEGPAEAGWQLSPTQHKVKCGRCGLSTPYLPTPDDAISAWNTRPQDAILEAAQRVADDYRELGLVRGRNINALAALEACRPAWRSGCDEYRRSLRFQWLSNQVMEREG
jgi:hypothetical protein